MLAARPRARYISPPVFFLVAFFSSALITVILVLLLVGTFVDWFFFPESEGRDLRQAAGYQVVNEERGSSQPLMNGHAGEVGRIVAGQDEKLPLISKPSSRAGISKCCFCE